MEQQTQGASKVLDPNGRPVERGALATRPAQLDVGAGRLDLLDPELPTEEAIRILETRALFRDKLIELALKRTHHSQYVVHRAEGDETRESVYPMGAAADAMFGFLGLSWAVAIPVKETDGVESWRRGDVKFETETLAVGDERVVWARSALWSKDHLVGIGVGKRRIGGFARDELTARLCAFENLKSQMVREVLGLKAKDRAWYLENGIDLSKARLAEYQDHKSATSADPQAATLPFGKEKGVKVCDATDETLRWILPKVRESVGDPKRARFKAQNEALVTAIEAEMAKRAAKPAAEAEQADEMERVVIALREEAQAQQSDPVKLEAFIAGLKTLEQAKGALDYYRRKRAEKEKKPVAAG